MSATFSKKSKQRRVHDLSIEVKAGTIALSIDAAQVTNATNLFTSVAHGLETGDRILAASVGTLPSGVTAIQYWIIASSDDTFQLASTAANAAAGTAVALADDGTDANTYTLVEELGGIDAGQMADKVKATLVGTYVLALPAGTFFDADAFAVHITPHIRDIVCSESRSARTATSITILVDSLDETAALVDGSFAVLISGSSIEDRYSN